MLLSIQTHAWKFYNLLEHRRGTGYYSGFSERSIDNGNISSFLKATRCLFRSQIGYLDLSSPMSSIDSGNLAADCMCSFTQFQLMTYVMLLLRFFVTQDDRMSALSKPQLNVLGLIKEPRNLKILPTELPHTTSGSIQQSCPSIGDPNPAYAIAQSNSTTPGEQKFWK